MARKKTKQTELAGWLGLSPSFLSEIKGKRKGLSRPKAQTLSDRLLLDYEQLSSLKGRRLFDYMNRSYKAYKKALKEAQKT